MPCPRKQPRVAHHPTLTMGRLYSPGEAAVFLCVSMQTLAHWRVRGVGPRHIHLSKRCIRYAESALREWVESRSLASTAENAGLE